MRMARSPCSGLTFAVGSLSNLGSPTEAKSTASDSSHILNVSSGKGSPTSSMACAPQRASLYVTLWPYFSAIAVSTPTPCSIISGPIPSPARTAILKSMMIVCLVCLLLLFCIFILLSSGKTLRDKRKLWHDVMPLYACRIWP